jgi:hypothetical protein
MAESARQLLFNYNSEATTEPPATWEELQSQVSTFTDKRPEAIRIEVIGPDGVLEVND